MNQLFRRVIVLGFILICSCEDIEDDITCVSTLRYAVPTDRVVGGNEAEPNSIPYQIALIVTSNYGTYFCGGSLISRRTVLTAAHCVEAARIIQVRLGAHYVDKLEQNQIRVNTRRYTIHESWNPYTLENDIALVHLPYDIPLSEGIKVIGLPSKTDTSQDFAGKIGKISGWGKDSDQASGTSPVLRYVYVRIVTNKFCNDLFNGFITDKHICTSGDEVIYFCDDEDGNGNGHSSVLFMEHNLIVVWLGPMVLWTIR